MEPNTLLPEEDNAGYLHSAFSDDLTHISDLTREAGEMKVIRMLQSFMVPIFVPIFRPLIRQIVEERVELAMQDHQASMKENPANRASNSVLKKKLKLMFRSRIGLPVFTGMPLLGEHKTPMEIALVDTLTEQIVNTGTESTAKLEIMGFRVGEVDDGTWMLDEFQEQIINERKGKQILQGNTCLQLKEGVGFIGKISFTHNSVHTKNGLYRLGAIVIDAALMNGVEVAWTEPFVMKDRRYTYYEKHIHPLLLGKVSHLQQISYKGTRFKRLKDAGVVLVKDLLILLYSDQKRLEDILELKASSKIWRDIVISAQASNGMFLYLDQSNERKTGVVLDVKLQLKALILEPHLYVPVNHLCDKQKVDNQHLVKFASEHLAELDSFDDETSLKEYLQLGTGFTSSPSADEPPKTSSQVTYPSNMNNSSCIPIVTSQSERGKEKVLFENEMICSTNEDQEYISFDPPNLESPIGLNFGTATEAGTSSQAVESFLDTQGLLNPFNINSSSSDELEFDDLLSFITSILSESPDRQCHPKPATIPVSIVARTRWINVYKLLRRNFVRKNISLSNGVEAHKKQRCC